MQDWRRLMFNAFYGQDVHGPSGVFDDGGLGLVGACMVVYHGILGVLAPSRHCERQAQPRLLAIQQTNSTRNPPLRRVAVVGD